MSSSSSIHYSAVRPTYNRSQLEKYVSKHIAPDPSYTLETLEDEIKQNPLAALGTLQIRQMSCCPWGNIALHYSWHRVVTLDADALYHKIVERGLGGYCMENNAFFSTVLRSLGYQLYESGARVSLSLDGEKDDPGFAGWQHEVIIVTIDNQKYLVDVGFGSASPLHPIPISSTPAAQETTYSSVPGVSLRLLHRPVASNTDQSQKLWVLESQTTSHPEIWQACYCFDLLEWLPPDFATVNFRASQDRASWFTHKLVLLKILLDEQRKEAVGTVVLTGEKIERRVGGKQKEVLLVANTESQRVEGLKKWFGMELMPAEIRGIRGTAAEIKKQPTVEVD